MEDNLEINKPVKKYWNCPFCQKRRELSDRTNLCYRGGWYWGCQNCFLDLIDNPQGFNNKNYYVKSR